MPNKKKGIGEDEDLKPIDIPEEDDKILPISEDDELLDDDMDEEDEEEPTDEEGGF